MPELNQKRIFYNSSMETDFITKSDYNKKLHVKYQLFIHNILFQTFYKKFTLSDYVPINKDNMCFELGNDPIVYYKVRNFLLDNNYIEVYKTVDKETGISKETYCANSKSKQYRLNQSYASNISAKLACDDYLTKLHKRKYLKLNTQLKTDEHAFRMFHQYKYLKINEYKAINHLNKIKSELTEIQYNFHLYYLNSFNDCYVNFFTWMNPGMRHYTQLTTLPSIYRQYLYFDKTQHNKDNKHKIDNKKYKLINLDIRNSQPLFFNILIQKYINSLKSNEKIKLNAIVLKNTLTNKTYSNTTINNLTNIKSILIDTIPDNGELYNSIIYLYSNIFNTNSNSDIIKLIQAEYTSFKQETENGKLYDNLISDCVDRKTFKINLFKDVFFSKYYKQYITDVELEFIKKYPIIYSIINYYKLNNYSDLSKSLQLEESNLIIRTICKRINQEYPHILLATIHDSIICEEPHKELVKNIMQEEFNKLNLIPTINHEYA